MTTIFVMMAWLILYYQTQHLPVQCLGGTTDVHKSMPQTLDGIELSQGHPEVRHETLSWLFARDSVLSVLICYNAKEMAQGQSGWKRHIRA